MRRPRVIAIGVLFAAIASTATFLGTSATVRTDMEFLLPRAPSPETRLIIDQMRAGPASNLLLIRLSGAPVDTLAALSDDLMVGLRSDSRFTSVANGRLAVDEPTLAWIARYRYLLNPPVTAAEFEPERLRASLKQALAAMATTIGLATKDLVGSDPTGRILRVGRNLAGTGGPATRLGVWFAPDGAAALLVARTAASGFDIGAQSDAIVAIQRRFAAVRAERRIGPDARIDLTGAGVFAVAVRDQIKGDVTWLTGAASLAVVAILLLALRSVTLVALFTLILASAVSAGAAAVQLAFGEIHGTTLTFGVALVGLAVDYPLHVVIHATPESGTGEAAQRIWPTLRLSALTTVAAFIPFSFSSFPALAQLGVISIVGLIVAALLSRYALPAVLPRIGAATVPLWLARQTGEAAAPGRWARPGVPALLVASAATIAALGLPVWQDDLSRLSPLPERQVRIDRSIRAALGAANTRYLLMLSGATPEAVLRVSEAAARHLGTLRERGDIAGFEAPSHYLPSAAAQRARQVILPDGEALRRNLEAARAGLPFRAGAFEPFLRDVAAARSGEVATVASAAGTQVALRIGAQLFPADGGWRGLILLRGDAIPAGALARSGELRALGANFIDLKAEADRLARDYRNETLRLLSISAVLTVIVLAAGLRRAVGIAMAFVPVLLAIACTAVLLVLTGSPLSVFHLMSLFVVAGIGFDYALFLQHGGDSPARARARGSVLLCGITSVIVFTILAFSSLPILQGIGLTIAIGIAFALALAHLFAAPRDRTVNA